MKTMCMAAVSHSLEIPLPGATGITFSVDDSAGVYWLPRFLSGCLIYRRGSNSFESYGYLLRFVVHGEKHEY